MGDSNLKLIILAFLGGFLLFIFLLRSQSKPISKESQQENKKVDDESLSLSKFESTDEVVELPVSFNSLNDKATANKSYIDEPVVEMKNIEIKESKLKNGLKKIEIAIPNLNTEPLKSAEIHSLSGSTAIVNSSNESYPSISMKKVSLSKVHKSNFVFLFIKDGCLTAMYSDGDFICEEWKYRQPSTGSDIEELISSALLKNTVLYYADDGDYEEKLHEIINRLNSVTANQISKLKTCSLFTAYKSFLRKRNYRFTYITNILKNEGLLEYGKQPDSSTIYCRRLGLLKSFLETNIASLSIIGDGINLKCDLTRVYSNIISKLDDESIISWDYDRLYFKNELIGKIKLSDGNILYEQSDLLYLRKEQGDSTHNIIAIDKSHRDYLYFLDKRTHQYHSEKNRKDILKVKKSLMDINVPKFTRKTFQVTSDYLSSGLTEKQKVTVRFLDVQHYLKQDVFRVDFMSSNGELMISTTSCSKAFIEAVRLSLYCKHNIEVVNIFKENIKLLIKNISD